MRKRGYYKVELRKTKNNGSSETVLPIQYIFNRVRRINVMHDYLTLINTIKGKA